MQPAGAERAGSGAGPDERSLLRFLLFLGSGLTAAGAAVNEIQDHLMAVAAAYGAPHARVAVLPTYLEIALEPGRAATLEPTRTLRGVLRLDQTAALYQLLREAKDGAVSPEAGSARVLEIVEMRPRFGRTLTIFGHAVLTAGICLVLQPTWGDMVLAALFGLIVGAFKLVGGRWPSLQLIMPVTVAFIVSSITFLLAGPGWADADLRAMIAPLVTFLPGAALTMSVVELSAGEMVTGASRLVSGALQLMLLAFGITAGAQVVGLPAADELIDSPQNLIGWWAPWLGVLVVGLGTYLYHSAPKRSLPWLMLVLIAAWIGQYLGSQLFGGYLSGFFGALVMTPVAYFVERRPSGPPALVSFLPAFWLLVPGALGLIGVAEYLGQDAVAAAQDLLGTVWSMIAIALGVLCGYPLYRSLARSLGWLRIPS
ncbi:threonine/serine exporter family protein [Actinoplanes sp. KI2]|uniref:threonine/serine ThrE exporter family protein n=1 Tax=Actinoplanes sp. KI2 TaxID=2983315 RepID=UPI0021D61592|nr:threonine/serine exporter family protein [Actinoplanes sp. KI2]MCU7727594.1 threonine/serine exporter family protein [Actinoplanes sp. KI2]